jgi:nitrous oxide reductase accessory protein NosL
VERLVCYIIEAEAAGGLGALLHPGDRAAAQNAAGSGGAILVFVPGAAEIDRTASQTLNPRC